MSHKSKMLWGQEFIQLHMEKYNTDSPVFVFKAYRIEDDTWMDIQRLEMWDFAFMTSVLGTAWDEILRWRMNMAGWEVDDGGISEEVESGESLKEQFLSK